MTNTKFIFFLYPYPIRNTEAPHIWSLYKGLEKMNPENIFCIGSQDYFKDAKYYQNRWESSWANKGWLKSDNIPNQNKYIIDTKYDKEIGLLLENDEEYSINSREL